MIVFPNAKINLGLNVLSKKIDGYHEIESCLYPIPFFDILEIVPSKKLVFDISGIKIPDDNHNNLCLKAYYLLKEKYDIPNVQIHLHKIIPAGAGLGGGSSDASFTLKILNSLFELKISLKELQEYATQLGSDCPFFIKNQPSIVTDVGTKLSKIDLDLSAYYLVLECFPVHIPTREAYSMVKPQKRKNSINTFLQRDLRTWKSCLTNDFEKPIFSNYKQIQKTKIDFYNKGAIYASMTGSGSAVYGIFEKKINISENVTWMGSLSHDNF